MVFEPVREVTKMFTDAGLTPVHENCMDYGGMSSAHALEMLDKCPGLKWVFDTANPIFNADRQLSAPWNSAKFSHERAQRTPRSRVGQAGTGTVSTRPVLLPETWLCALCALSRSFHFGVL